jgi:hypothetical protein
MSQTPKIIFFANVTTIVFGEDGQQMEALQRS